MKRIEITLLIVAIFASGLFSQTYYPLPESNSYWRYSSLEIPAFCGCWGVCSEEQYQIAGDTIINNYTYHKLEHKGYWLSNNCEENFFTHGYEGAFRNDIENKKVWFVPEGEQEESLLYEFDLQIGDTLSEGILDPDDYYQFWVEDIDTVEIGNTLRKRFYIRSELNLGELPLIIIEGIGGQHFFEPFGNWWYFEIGFTFDCININDSLKYPYTCEMIVTNKDKIAKADFNIFPNPTSGKFWIKQPESDQKILSIEIYNSFGEKLNQPEPVNHNTAIDLSDQPKGLYFVRIKSEATNFTQKIIVE